MFCGKCGAKNPENAMFCEKCGAPMETEKAAPAPAAAADVSARNKLVGIAAVAVAAVVVIVLLFSLLGGRSYKSTVTKFLDATFDADAKAIVNLIPDKVVDHSLRGMGITKADMDDALDELREDLQDEVSTLTRYLGDGWKISYEIVSAEDVSSSKLLSLQQSYSVYDVKVSAAKNVEVTLIFKVGGQEATYPLTVPVIQVGRSWYLDAENFSGIL